MLGYEDDIYIAFVCIRMCTFRIHIVSFDMIFLKRCRKQMSYLWQRASHTHERERSKKYTSYNKVWQLSLRKQEAGKKFIILFNHLERIFVTCLHSRGSDLRKRHHHQLVQEQEGGGGVIAMIHSLAHCRLLAIRRMSHFIHSSIGNNDEIDDTLSSRRRRSLLCPAFLSHFLCVSLFPSNDDPFAARFNVFPRPEAFVASIVAISFLRHFFLPEPHKRKISIHLRLA